MCSLTMSWAFSYFHVLAWAWLYGHDLDDDLVQWVAVNGIAGSTPQDVVFLLTRHYSRRQYLQVVMDYDNAQTINELYSLSEQSASGYANLAYTMSEQGSKDLHEWQAAAATKVGDVARSVVQSVDRKLAPVAKRAEGFVDNIAGYGRKGTEVVKRVASSAKSTFTDAFVKAGGCQEGFFDGLRSQIRTRVLSQTRKVGKIGEKMMENEAIMRPLVGAVGSAQKAVEQASGGVNQMSEIMSKVSTKAEESWAKYGANLVPILGSVLQGYLQATGVQQIADYASEVFALTYQVKHPPFDPSKVEKPHYSCAQGMGQCAVASGCLQDPQYMAQCYMTCQQRWCPSATASTELLATAKPPCPGGGVFLAPLLFAVCFGSSCRQVARPDDF